MSATLDDCDAGGGLCAPPSFELGYEVDDPAEPTEVTVYPDDADEDELVTTWISVDADDAVPLEAMR